MPRVVNDKNKKGTGARRNNLYDMPEKISDGTILTDLTKTQWRVGATIGTGGFGDIYSACRVGEKNYNYVIKCEPHGNGPLFVEMHFYMRKAKLEDIKKFEKKHGLKLLGMPHMLGNGSAEINGKKHRFIVLPRYGSDVAKHFLANGRCLPEGTVYRIAIQMLNVYEFIHDAGYVHADLKAANILLGLGKGGGAQTYLLDFGLASQHTTKEFKPDPKKMHNGTIEYTSRDAHLGVATMRADLEILGYNIIEWLGAELPWVRDKILTTPAKVQKAKEEFMRDVTVNLLKIFPKNASAPIVEYMRYVSKLEYNERPNYVKCRKIFADALYTLKISTTGDLDLKISKKMKAKTSSIEIDSSEEEIYDSSSEDNKNMKKALKPKIIKNKSPLAKKSPKEKRKQTPSPIKNKFVKTPPPKSVKSISTSKELNTSASTKLSPKRNTRKSPLVTKASLNFSPSITVRSSSRSGKTVINDNLTPNPRSGKTYEFNFELDVSMDANVIVNVKRKKKAPPVFATPNGSTEENSNRRRPRQADMEDATDTPVTRVKVRRVTSPDNAASPRTPSVTLKKTKRVGTPK